LEAAEKKELQTIERICSEIRDSKAIDGKLRAKLLAHFAGRFENALELIEKKRVKKYLFSPSGRVVWAVKGRKREYQVIPDSNFCCCDDYYFRVIDRRRQLCYHIIAQRLADALGNYVSEKLPDSAYNKITERWRLEETP
jgi:predicted nucleic acid-binding Zn finger protein